MRPVGGLQRIDTKPGVICNFDLPVGLSVIANGYEDLMFQQFGLESRPDIWIVASLDEQFFESILRLKLAFKNCWQRQLVIFVGMLLAFEPV